jgi:DNA replication protein DnaC
MTYKTQITPSDRLMELLLSFRLTTAATELTTRLGQAGHTESIPVLLEVLEQEAQDRLDRKIQRYRNASKLPPGKTFDTMHDAHLPRKLMQTLKELATGRFLEEAVNVLAFGLPGVGKTHVACALGHALIEAGHRVLFTPTYLLVQQLLAAKRDLELPKALHKLDAFELLILDDIGYVQQSAEEVEVLFTLMAERYERKSMLITSNLVFSQWDQIFKNPMTTAAAIDRIVHHSVILEFDVPSYRTDKQRGAVKESKTTTTKRGKKNGK